MSKKTIFHLIYVLNPGGTENNLVRLLPDLERHYRNVVVALKGYGPVADSLKKMGIPVYWLDHGRFLSFLRTFSRFRKLVRQYHPDVLSTYLPISDLFGRIAGRLLGIPKIVCNLRSTHRNRRYRKAILADFLTHSLVNQYTVNSPTITDYYASRYPYSKDQFFYIPNRIDFEQFSPAPLKASVSQKFVFTYVSNLHAAKGHSTLVEAFESLAQSHPHAELWLVGDGQAKANLQLKIASYSSKKQIHFLGKRSDVADLLRKTDVFVFPSLFEGQSNALLEAMATGCAVVASDIPENRILIEDGVTGLLFTPGHAEELRLALSRLMDDVVLRRALGKSARAFVEKEFNPRIILKRWCSIYEPSAEGSYE